MTLYDYFVELADYDPVYAQYCVNDYLDHEGMNLSDDDWANILDYKVHFE